MQAPVAAPPSDPFANFAERMVNAMEKAAGSRAVAGVGPYASGYKHDVAGSPISVGYSHGPGGNLSFPGVDPTVYHAIVGSKGILGQLPVMPSLDTNPTYFVVTGVTDDTGDEKTDVCDDAPVAGLVKSVLLTSVFGRYERATSQLELNRLGQRNDRADPMDLRLVGSPIADSGLFASGPGDPSVPADLLANEFSRKMWELGVSFHRLLSRQIWSGNPANNNGDAYRELTGLDLLINTGHVDAQTNVAAPSIDSDVRDFNYLTVEDNGPALVETLASMYHIAKDNAIRTGVDPVRWVIAMAPDLFHRVTEVWPCSYLTYRCALEGIDGARVNIDGSEQVRMRDEMRNGSYLLIDSDRVEVVLDDGIATASSTTDANVPEAAFASTIYLVPMSVAGGRAVTFLEHFDYQNPSLQDALGNLVLGRVEGPWITVPRQRNWCIQWQSKIEPRLVMRTPWLAARLDNVVAAPLKRTRSPFPDDPYHLNGGNTSRPGPSYYSLWQS